MGDIDQKVKTYGFGQVELKHNIKSEHENARNYKEETYSTSDVRRTVIE